MELQGKKVLVAGCGKSGLGAAGLLKKTGACPVLFDENEEIDRESLTARKDYPEGVLLVLGKLEDALIKELSLAVISPGISIEEPFVERLKEAGVPIWGEVELAWQFGKGRLIAITGTNG